MSDLRKAAEQAIAALESVEVVGGEVFRVASDCHYAIEALRAALAEQPQPVAPSQAQGWAMVRYPITEAMHIAAAKVLARAHGLAGTPQRMLDAMIAAAPPTREPAEPQPVAPRIEYAVTVIDNAHPQGIPYEQWVRKPPTREPVRLTDEQVWASDAIMECNAHIGAPMNELMRLVRAVESAVLAGSTHPADASIPGARIDAKERP